MPPCMYYLVRPRPPTFTYFCIYDNLFHHIDISDSFEMKTCKVHETFCILCKPTIVMTIGFFHKNAQLLLYESKDISVQLPHTYAHTRIYNFTLTQPQPFV